MEREGGRAVEHQQSSSKWEESSCEANLGPKERRVEGYKIYIL
jgi:hypothetical protein